MRTSKVFSRIGGFVHNQVTKKIGLRLIISVLIAALINGVSIWVGVKALAGHRMTRLLLVEDFQMLLAEKFQLVTIVTYVLLSGMFMAWALQVKKVLLGEPMTYVATPAVLYYFFAGSVLYYVLLFVLACIMIWRTLSLRDQEERNLTKQPKETT